MANEAIEVVLWGTRIGVVSTSGDAKTPTYDMTYAHSPAKDGWTSAHQMSINGKFIGAGYDDLIVCSREANLTPRKARSMIEEVKAALSEWQRFAQDAGVDEDKAAAIGRMICKSVCSS